MKSSLCQILSAFVLQLFATGVEGLPPSRSYYGPISSKPKHFKHEPEKFVLDVSFENFREIEAKSLEEEVREVLSQIVPVALAAAIQKDDPYRLLADIGDEGWNTVQLALVRISSILYRDDLSFVGGSGGMDLNELWENSCTGGKTDAAVWHGYTTNDGGKKGSNTIFICPTFFKKQGTASTSHRKRVREYMYVCEEAGSRKLMELRSAILLRELSQTSHIGGGLRPHGKNIVEMTASKSQKVLKKTNSYRKEQVDVELFNLYAILAWRKSVCGRRDEKHV